MFVGKIPLGNFGYFLVRVVRRNFEKFAVFVGNFAVSHFVLGAWAIEFRALAEILCVVRICDSFEVDCRENWEFWGEFLVSVVCAGRLVWRPQRKLLFWNGMS